MSVNAANNVGQDWEWNVAVFCQNEAARIGLCIASIAAAIGSRRALVTLVLNGTTDDSAAIAWQAARDLGVPIEIYRIPYGDKSNAIDQFFYRLRVPARLYFCVDGYVKIGPHWTRTTIVDPVTALPVSAGEIGLLQIFDLCNRGSVCAVLTGDLAREHDGGVEIIGRHPGAPPKGCSIAADAMLGGESA